MKILFKRRNYSTDTQTSVCVSDTFLPLIQKGRSGAHTVSYIHMCLDACLGCFKDEQNFYVVTFYQSLKPADDSCSGGRRSTFFFLFVLLSLPFPLARVAAIPSTFAVACTGLGRRQRLHAQDLVDLAEGNQAQSVLRAERGGKCSSL